MPVRGIFFAVCILAIPSPLLAQPLASELLDRGRSYFRMGDFDRAIEDYNEAIQLDPKNSAAFLSRGCALGGKKKWNAAIKDFTESIRLDPKNAWAWYNRGFARLVLEPVEPNEKPVMHESVKDFDQAIRLDPKNSLSFLYRGIALSWSNPTQSMEDCSECIRLDPANVMAYRIRISVRSAGFGTEELRVMKENLVDADSIVRLTPKDVSAWILRGNLRHIAKDISGAAGDFNAAIRINPMSPDALFARGEYRLAEGEWAKAFEDFEAVLGIDPKHSGAMKEKAWIYAACPEEKLRNGTTALVLAKEYLKRYETEGTIGGTAQALMAGAYAELGDFEEAVKWQKLMLEDRFVKLLMSRYGWDGPSKVLKLYEAKKPSRLGKGSRPAVVIPSPWNFLPRGPRTRTSE
jgi:tetratricopeptide (TPR) repeat protein